MPLHRQHGVLIPGLQGTPAVHRVWTFMQGKQVSGEKKKVLLFCIKIFYINHSNLIFIQ